jgi:hypothetical protein
LGEILAKAEGRLRRGTRQEPRETTPRLADVGISKKLSSRAQKLAAVPAEVFEAKIAEAKDG